MIYISRLRLVNVKGFSGETIIDFNVPKDRRPSWTLILGDNATGKTILLRAIAISLCDETAASAS
jgi:DNA repair exonuclease SbcCD ATPase subunit